MASNSIEQLPTDVLATVVRLLPISDIKRFRLVNKWAERESFNIFAQRGYHSLFIMPDHEAENLGDCVKVLTATPALGNAVRTLKLSSNLALCRNCRRQYCTDDRNTSGHTGMPVDLKNKSLVPLLSALPHLAELKLNGVGRANATRPGYRESGMGDAEHNLQQSEAAFRDLHFSVSPDLRPPIAAIRLSDCILSNSNLLALFQDWGGTLQRVELRDVFLHDGGWRLVLSSIQDLCPLLRQLYVITLRSGVPRGSYSPIISLNDTGRAFVRALKSCSGVEVANVSKTWADLRGREAIRVGLEKILSFIEN